MNPEPNPMPRFGDDITRGGEMGPIIARRGATMGSGRRAPRRWGVPPVLLSDPGFVENFDGERILQEIEGVAGLLLWQVYRDGRLWATTPVELRPKLFRRGTARRREYMLHAAGLDSGISEAVRHLWSGFRYNVVGATPGARNALRVSTWAEGINAASTAVAFAQLGAALNPESAPAALRVGMVAARVGRSAVAETWFRRTIALSRQTRNHEPYASAMLGLAELSVAAARLEHAARSYMTAQRVARRIGARALRLKSIYGLLRLALLAGDNEKASTLARSAIQSLRAGGENREVPPGHLDVAELHLRLGRFRDARNELQRCAAGQTSMDDRVRIATMLVRAYNGLNEYREMQHAWFTAAALIETLGETEDVARKLLELAFASAEALEESHADRCARRALEIARRSGSMTLVQDCNAFLARPRIRLDGHREDAA